MRRIRFCNSAAVQTNCLKSNCTVYRLLRILRGLQILIYCFGQRCVAHFTISRTQQNSLSFPRS